MAIEAGGRGMERSIRTAPRRTGRRRGFTLLELTVAILVLVIALMAISSSLLGSMRLNEVNRESSLSQDAMDAMLENLRGAEFETVFRRYDSDPSNDPAVGPSPGPDFVVAGLGLVAGDADGCVGKIILPELVTAGGSQLREDLDMPELGMPCDLNGDGAIDDIDHEAVADYRILPVLLRLEWTGRNGRRSAETRTILARR
jgi:prepilin-type N-terminal cleavage/methylation domain-containing protein